MLGGGPGAAMDGPDHGAAAFGDQVCAVRTQACPPAARGKQDACSLCESLVVDLGYELSVQGPALAGLSVSKRAWHVLVHQLCSEVAGSHHFRPHAAAEACEDLVDEHGPALVAWVAALAEERGVQGAQMPWPDASDAQRFCAGKLCPRLAIDGTEASKGEL